jgi:Flp pilus assembly protein TadD
MTLQEALQLHRDGDLDAAESAYQDYLAATPDDPDALHLLGVLQHQRGRDDAAVATLRSAIAQAPQRARFHLSLGGALMQLGDEPAALASFEQALALDPNSVEAHAVLGYLHLQHGELDQAETRFRTGRRAEDEDPMLLLGLGNLYLGRGDAERALKFLTRAAERKPEDAMIQLNVGRAFFEAGNFAFAEQAFLNALRLQADLSVARLYQGRIRVRQKQYDAARGIFSGLLDANQQAFGANAGLGDVARAQSRIVQALKFYRRAWMIEPNNPGAANACAWCMEQLGDFAGAAAYLATGLERTPDAHWLRAPLAGLLERAGRADEAARVRAPADANS